MCADFGDVRGDIDLHRNVIGDVHGQWVGSDYR